MKKFLPLFLLLILAISVWYVLDTKRLSNPEISNNQISFGSEEEKFTVVVNYPVITRGIPKKSAAVINPILEAWAKSKAEDAQKQFAELAKDETAVPEYATLSYVSQYKETHDFNFAPHINFKFENYTYGGGAHGNTGLSTFVFNAKTGRQLSFADLFSGEEYLENLSGASLAQIKKIDPKLETYVFTEDGLKPIAENFSSWEVLPAGLRITFGDYQVGPYTAGRPEIVIPWAELGQILKSEFISTLHLSIHN